MARRLWRPLHSWQGDLWERFHQTLCRRTCCCTLRIPRLKPGQLGPLSRQLPAPTALPQGQHPQGNRHQPHQPRGSSSRCTYMGPSESGHPVSRPKAPLHQLCPALGQHSLLKRPLLTRLLGALVPPAQPASGGRQRGLVHTPLDGRLAIFLHPSGLRPGASPGTRDCAWWLSRSPRKASSP